MKALLKGGAGRSMYYGHPIPILDDIEKLIFLIRYTEIKGSTFPPNFQVVHLLITLYMSLCILFL